MKIAVITGASSGMGKAFTKQIDEKYQELDEIWVIARKKEGLEGLKKEISKLRILPMDLTDRQALEEFSTLLKREKPCIQILVESAGMGIQKKIEDTAVDDLRRMTELNCTALTAFVAMSSLLRKGQPYFMSCKWCCFCATAEFCGVCCFKVLCAFFCKGSGSRAKGQNCGYSRMSGTGRYPIFRENGRKRKYAFL